jgi:hypothetical protein
VYRYRRRPLLLVRVNTENDKTRIFYIDCIYTYNHGQKCLVFDFRFLFIPNASLYDTKKFDNQATNLVMHDV